MYEEYWWAVLLMGIAFIIFMGLFIKCCAVHTPSSNPKKPPARRFSETLRRPMNTFRRMRTPHGGGGGHPGPGYGKTCPRSSTRIWRRKGAVLCTKSNCSTCELQSEEKFVCTCCKTWHPP
ncbi:hypothetical protein L9F63_023408, partial [Diploptera punctata]